MMHLGRLSGVATAAALGLVALCPPSGAGQGSYPLGDLGGRAAIVAGQPDRLRMAAVHLGGPAATAGLAEGDVIAGVDGQAFAQGYLMPLRQLGTAIDDAQGRDGRLRLTLERDGSSRAITVRLPKTGRFSATYPFACAKSERIYQQVCGAITAELGRGTLPGGDLTTAIALMGLMGDRSGRGLEAARPAVLRLAQAYAAGPKQRSVWVLSYVGVMLCEYQMAAGDAVVAAAIRRIAEVLVAGVPKHGRYGHHVNTDPEDLPYGGQGLNGTTTAVLWFFASAARAGLEPSALEPAFSRALRRIRDETAAGGGVGYAWPGDDQSCMRSGHTALACHHIVQLPEWLAADPQALPQYRAAVASWPTRHAADLLEAHAVSSLGLTASTAGLAAFDLKAHHTLMQHWRWLFTLAWQPLPGGDHQVAYVGGPNNTGGDFYLNGHRPLENDDFNSIMNATVAFIFAAAHERLSFYGGMPGVPGLSSTVLAASPGLRQATAALRQRRYGEAHRLAVRVAGPEPDQITDAGEGPAASAAPMVAAAFVKHVEARYLEPELERLRQRRSAGDLVLAIDGLKRFLADVKGIKAFEEPARALLDELEQDEFDSAIAIGKRYHRLEKQARRGSLAALDDLAALADEHRGSYYAAAAERLVTAIRAGEPADEPAGQAAAAEPRRPDREVEPEVEADEAPLPNRPLTLDELLGPADASPEAAPPLDPPPPDSP